MGGKCRGDRYDSLINSTDPQNTWPFPDLHENQLLHGGKTTSNLISNSLNFFNAYMSRIIRLILSCYISKVQCREGWYEVLISQTFKQWFLKKKKALFPLKAHWRKCHDTTNSPRVQFNHKAKTEWNIQITIWQGNLVQNVNFWKKMLKKGKEKN